MRIPDHVLSYWFYLLNILLEDKWIWIFNRFFRRNPYACVCQLGLIFTRQKTSALGQLKLRFICLREGQLQRGVFKLSQSGESLEGALTSQQNWSPLFPDFTGSQTTPPAPAIKINNKYEKCLEKYMFGGDHVPYLLTNKGRTTIQNRQYSNKWKLQDFVALQWAAQYMFREKILGKRAAQLSPLRRYIHSRHHSQS